MGAGPPAGDAVGYARDHRPHDLSLRHRSEGFFPAAGRRPFVGNDYRRPVDLFPGDEEPRGAVREHRHGRSRRREPERLRRRQRVRRRRREQRPHERHTEAAEGAEAQLRPGDCAAPSQARPCPRREPLPPGHPGPARRGTVERCAVSIHTTERLGEGSQPMGPPGATQASLLAGAGRCQYRPAG